LRHDIISLAGQAVNFRSLNNYSVDVIILIIIIRPGNRQENTGKYYGDEPLKRRDSDIFSGKILNRPNNIVVLTKNPTRKRGAAVDCRSSDETSGTLAASRKSPVKIPAGACIQGLN
jgi:hypothetical protein